MNRLFSIQDIETEMAGIRAFFAPLSADEVLRMAKRLVRARGREYRTLYEHRTLTIGDLYISLTGGNLRIEVNRVTVLDNRSIGGIVEFHRGSWIDTIATEHRGLYSE